jgi:hypothetical protein
MYPGNSCGYRVPSLNRPLPAELILVFQNSFRLCPASLELLLILLNILLTGVEAWRFSIFHWNYDGETVRKKSLYPEKSNRAYAVDSHRTKC